MNILLRLIPLIFLSFAGQSYATTAMPYGYEVNVVQSGVENLNNNGLINHSGCCSKLSSRDSQDRAQARAFFALTAGFDVPKGKPDFVVTTDGVAIPQNPSVLKENLKQLDMQPTSTATSKKYVGEDALGPLRARIEKAHPSDPNFTGTPDPLHTVDHLHIDRRKNVTSGPWKSKEKIQYDWPFD